MHTLVAEVGKHSEFVFKTQSNRQHKIRIFVPTTCSTCFGTPKVKKTEFPIDFSDGGMT